MGGISSLLFIIRVLILSLVLVVYSELVTINQRPTWLQSACYNSTLQPSYTTEPTPHTSYTKAPTTNPYPHHTDPQPILSSNSIPKTNAVSTFFILPNFSKPLETYQQYPIAYIIEFLVCFYFYFSHMHLHICMKIFLLFVQVRCRFWGDFVGFARWSLGNCWRFSHGKGRRRGKGKGRIRVRRAGISRFSFRE